MHKKDLDLLQFFDFTVGKLYRPKNNFVWYIDGLYPLPNNIKIPTTNDILLFVKEEKFYRNNILDPEKRSLDIFPTFLYKKSLIHVLYIRRLKEYKIYGMEQTCDHFELID